MGGGEEGNHYERYSSLWQGDSGYVSDVYVGKMTANDVVVT